MSDYDYTVGKLTPVEITESVEHTCGLILSWLNIECDDNYDTCAEQLDDEYSDQYLITDIAIYRIQSEDKDPYNDIFNARRKDDGSIEFEVQYYNGGCSLNEAIKEAIKRMEATE